MNTSTEGCKEENLFAPVTVTSRHNKSEGGFNKSGPYFWEAYENKILVFGSRLMFSGNTPIPMYIFFSIFPREELAWHLIDP